MRVAADSDHLWKKLGQILLEAQLGADLIDCLAKAGQKFCQLVPVSEGRMTPR